MLSIFKRISVRVRAFGSMERVPLDKSASLTCRPFEGTLKERESRPLPIEMKPPLDRYC